MTKEQSHQLAALNEVLVVLQNKCNRAQSALVKAEQAEDEETIDRLLREASIELG